MSGITTGVGIFSGIDSRTLISQLLQIESRPKTLAQQRLLQLQTQQSAFLDINSALLGVRSAAGAFKTNNVFKASRATSSNPQAVTATAAVNAATGTFNIAVQRLVTTHQEISRGFNNKDVSGIGAERFTFEVGGGRLDSETTLAELNGGEGIQRGKIEITDSAGGTATIDLSAAVTVTDVLDAINASSAVSVVASVDGDRISLLDSAGGAGQFSVKDVFGSSTATSLGIRQTVAAGASITSTSSLHRITEATALSQLNDGTGVSFGPGGPNALPDFRILLGDPGDPGSAETFNIVLGEKGAFAPDPDTGQNVYTKTNTPVATVGDLIERIALETGGKVVASISSDGTRLELTDTTGVAGRELTVENGARRSAAQDLGLSGITATGATGSQSISGRRLLAGINSRLGSSLNGGAGVGAGSFNVTRRDGSAFAVSIVADDSVADIIGKINAAGGGTVTAALNRSGNGLKITDSTTGGDLVIADTSGTVAEKLKIATAGASSGVVDSGNLQTKYISGATLLSSLGGGVGVGTGEFRITDSDGKTSRFNITADIRTVDDLVVLVNSRLQIGVTARVNENGDGIEFEDTAGGGQKLKVEDLSGVVAKRLNLAGESASADAGENKIDGTFEREILFNATDTLQTVANKLNAAGAGVDATIVNSGAGASPFKLILTSKTTGQIGRFVVDTGGFDLGLDTISRGDDAVAFFGAGSAANAVLLTSSTNTLDNVVTGVTIDLLGTTQTPAEIVVSRDTAQVESTVNSFVEAYNNAITRLAFHDRFNPETNERGVLLGDSTVANIRASLVRTVQGEPLNVDGQYSRLFQVGVKIGEGGKLSFDRERFRSALEQDPEGVAALFAAFEQAPNEPRVLATNPDGSPQITTPNTGTTQTRLGVAEQIKLLATQLTDSVDGLLALRGSTLKTQVELQQTRIAQFDQRLATRRLQLENQFTQMEKALAQLQRQQQVLGSIGG